jgi:alkaline phosphatase D
MVSELRLNFARRREPVIATELCGPSITSPGRPQRRTEAIMRANPHMLFGDSVHRGYMVLELTRERCVVRLRVLDDVTRPSARVSTLARFVIDAGRPAVRRL